MTNNNVISYRFPQAAFVGKRVPKEKLYLHGNPGNKVRQCLIDQVDKITWQYKLAPETINLPASDKLLEIQVFDISLKSGYDEVDESVLRLIDKTISHPLYFRIYKPEQIQFAMAYKRPSDAASDQWVTGEYFYSPWQRVELAEQSMQPLPVVTQIVALYEILLRNLIDQPARPGESLPQLMQRIADIRTYQKQLAQLQTRLMQEKQFNRRVEINHDINQLSQALQALMSE
jgi:hypothetical protein